MSSFSKDGKNDHLDCQERPSGGQDVIHVGALLPLCAAPLQLTAYCLDVTLAETRPSGPNNGPVDQFLSICLVLP